MLGTIFSRGLTHYFSVRVNIYCSRMLWLKITYSVCVWIFIAMKEHVTQCDSGASGPEEYDISDFGDSAAGGGGIVTLLDFGLFLRFVDSRKKRRTRGRRPYPGLKKIRNLTQPYVKDIYQKLEINKGLSGKWKKNMKTLRLFQQSLRMTGTMLHLT